MLKANSHQLLFLYLEKGDWEVQRHCLRCIRNISSLDEARNHMIREGAVQRLIPLATSNHAMVRQLVVEILATWATNRKLRRQI